MNKFKTFFRTLLKSLTNFSYYQEVLSASFSFSVKYLFFLLVLIVFIYSLRFSLSILPSLPKIPNFVKQLKSVVANFYPEELVITLDNGRIRTNVDEPYFIEVPRELKISNKPHLITIDTRASVEDFKKYNTLILITKNAVVYPDRQSRGVSYKIQFLNEIKGHYLLDKTVYTQTVNKLLPYFDYLKTIVYILTFICLFIWPFFAGVFYLGGVMLYLLPISFLLFLVSRIIKKTLSYGKVYQLTMHGFTLPAILSVFNNLFHLRLPYLYSFLFLIWMVAILSNLKNNSLTT